MINYNLVLTKLLTSHPSDSLSPLPLPSPAFLHTKARYSREATLTTISKISLAHLSTSSPITKSKSCKNWVGSPAAKLAGSFVEICTTGISG